MNAQFLLALFDSAYVLALTAWVGSVLFFAFAIAPLLFQVLGAEAGAKLIRSLLPRFYTWGAICGAIALPSYLGGPLSFQEFRGPIVALQSFLILAGTLLMLYAANSLAPAIQAAAAAGPEGKVQFNRLYRRSVRLNGVVLVLGVVLLVAFATRPAPKTAGIIEPTPLERARSAYERLQAQPGTSRTSGEAPAATPDRRDR